LFVGGGAQRRDFGLELVGAGLATVDERKIEYGEAPKVLIEAQNRAIANKAGLWSLEQKQEQPVVKTTIKAKEEVATIRLSEICSGSHFFFHVVGDKAASIIEEGMKLFTAEHGTYGAPCDLKAGKIVAALFDGSWYRAKLLKKEGMKVKVLYIDHGNVATVPISTHLRPLDASLGVERIPAVAKEAILAFTKTRSLEDDDGIDAARLLQSQCWGKDITARIFCEVEGKLVVSLYLPNRQGTFNEKLIADGLARVAKSSEVNEVSSKMLNSNSLVELVAELKVAEESARKTRSGMWRYGDVGDDDEDI
jgi:staphylococcal nuclease domain-containing protein 1